MGPALDAADAFGVVGYGEAVEVFKDVGSGEEVCTRYGIAGRGGYLGIGHTRMATESAVTPAHSHPFVTAPDLCLVHNGSFSNHATIRRRLIADGVTFDSDNDSEVAARFLAYRLAAGDDLGGGVAVAEQGVRRVLHPGHHDRQRLGRRPRPLCLQASRRRRDDRYVAMASEYRALADASRIDDARVFEPNPGETYQWSR